MRLENKCLFCDFIRIKQSKRLTTNLLGERFINYKLLYFMKVYWNFRSQVGLLNRVLGSNLYKGNRPRCFRKVLTLTYSSTAPASSGDSVDKILDNGITIFLLGWIRLGIHLLNDNYANASITQGAASLLVGGKLKYCSSPTRRYYFYAKISSSMAFILCALS